MARGRTGIRRVSGLRDKIRRNVGEVGLLGMLHRAVRRVIRTASGAASSKHDFDLKYGTDTSGTIEPDALDIPPDRIAHAIRYQTAIVDVFLDILRNLPVQFRDFIFVDMGSGKGRALLLASQFPFKQIVGVELSAALHEIACRNIRLYREDQQQCHTITAICEDASRYEIPRDRVVFYLFNPFDEMVMRAVLANIEASVQEYPRDMYVAYLKPVHRHVFDRSKCFRIERDDERYVIYRTRGGDVQEPAVPVRS